MAGGPKDERTLTTNSVENQSNYDDVFLVYNSLAVRPKTLDAALTLNKTHDQTKHSGATVSMRGGPKTERLCVWHERHHSH